MAPLFRQTSVTDPRGGVTTYGYDLAGNQTSVTDPDGNQTTYGYDAANRQTKMTDALGHSQTYAYDAANELTSTTDRDGRTIDYAYDQAGRMTGETWVGGSYTATFSYNKDSLVTLAQDPYSKYTYGYNADSQVTSVDNAGTPGVPTVTLSYSYDGFQNVTSLTDSLGGGVAYGYNSNNQLTSLALSVSSTMDAKVTMAYDAANRLTGMTLTGVSGTDKITSALSYDNANRLTNITDTDTTSSTTLANYTYGYDQGSELTSYTDNSSSSLTYGYDADGELTSATGTLNSSSYSVSYSYDANGNRNMTGYTTGTNNELQSDGTYSYTYDNNGNLTTQTTIATGSVTYYTWDYENRLTEVKEETSGATVIYDEKFTYDVNNNRIGESLNGTQQLYTVYDGSNPYIDFSGTGTLTERYLTNPQTLSQFYGQVSGSGTTQWFLTDNINSVRQVVSTSGSVLDAITYDPFGNIVNQTNATNAPRFLYAGGAYDSNAGNYQDDARYYDPSPGRFVSQDPLGFKSGDTDLYRYAYNDPVLLDDPTGMAVAKLRAPEPWLVQLAMTLEQRQRNKPSNSWSLYRRVYTGSGYTSDAIYETAMAESGQYLYDHSPFRGVYAFGGIEGENGEALGLGGYDIGDGLWAGGLGAGLTPWPGVTAGLEVTTTEGISSIVLVDPHIPGPWGSHLGAFATSHDFGVYQYWDYGPFVGGWGLNFSNENLPNYLNGDYWGGRLPPKKPPFVK